MPIDLESDIRFPLNRDDATTSLLTAMLLAIFSWLLIPAFPLWGYFGRVVRTGIQDVDEPPVFDEWDELSIDGFKLLALLFVYQLIPLAVIGVAIALGLGLTLTGDETVAGVGVLALVGGTLIGGGLLLVVGYVVPAAIANAVRNDQFTAGFDVGTLTDVLVERDYVLHWFYAIGLSIGIYVVASIVGSAIWFVFSILSIIPLIGVLFALIGFLVSSLIWTVVGVYGQIVVMRVWGRGYAEALGLHDAEPEPEPAETEPVEPVAGGSGEPAEEPSGSGETETEAPTEPTETSSESGERAQEPTEEETSTDLEAPESEPSAEPETQPESETPTDGSDSFEFEGIGESKESVEDDESNGSEADESNDSETDGSSGSTEKSD